jgi:predicted DsbA family dithiol-disulfide isomerase
MTSIEVFADITCPFTHVGLKRVVQHVSEMAEPADVIVRAWPLEWVNGTPLAVDAVVVKAHAEGFEPSTLGSEDRCSIR